MRILWVAPWGRALGRVYLEEFARTGHEVLLVTTDRHFERWDAPAPYERLVTGSPKEPRSWPSVGRALAAARLLRPDVVVAEEFHDPRLLPLLAGAPRAVLVHDDAPHDATEVKALHHRLASGVVSRRADLLVTFSAFVGRAVAARRAVRVATVPLPSEADERLVPPLVPAAGRRDVVLLGRIGPYKNLPGTLEAWAAHVRSAAYRGDRLLIIGDGSQGTLALPPAAEWRRERFQFADVLPVLASANASLAYYASATQSGVQVVSMQCGTSVLVSDAGGLAEYLPPGEQAVPLSAPERLVAALGEVADPHVAEERGRRARARYEQRHRPAAAAAALLDVLDRLRHRPVTVTAPR